LKRKLLAFQLLFNHDAGMGFKDFMTSLKGFTPGMEVIALYKYTFSAVKPSG
jgi:hypothetical protein